MTEVRHDRDVPAAHFFHVSEQLNQRIRIRIGGKTLRPERERPRPDPQILDVRQVVRIFEGLQVLLEPV